MMRLDLRLRGRRKLSQSSAQAGFILPTLLSFIIVMSIIVAGLVEVINTNYGLVSNNVKSQQAFNIAEAGINYYLWHLSHNSTDFKDGQSTPTTPDPSLGYGPYVHQYIDANAVNEGTFTLYINPQGGGSTIATVRSIGQVAGSTSTRTMQAQIGASSFASYAVSSDSALWFGPNETADGPVQSNQGIRMDGPNTSDVTSANTTYVPPNQLGGDGASHPGVWCSASVTTPVNCNTRSKASWHYPQTTIDYNQVTTSLCTMKKAAFASNSATSALATQSNACTQIPTTRTSAYLPQRSTSFSSTKGYLIELNTNGTYNLYNVNSEDDTQATYTAALSPGTAIATNVAIPSSGVIFAEDNVWVRSNPTFHGRVTIGAGRLATTNNADINIADDLAYSTKNGQDSIGLVAEDSIIVSPYAPPASGNFTFEVDGALLAQSGNVEFPGVYRANTNRCTRGWTSSSQTMNFYGSIATRQDWTWSWLEGTSQCGDAVRDPSSGQYISGFLNNTTHYDYNLLYAPPPSYPITGGYTIISWREILTHP
jgi:Tfp pilus assembly protein PilX